MKGKHRYPILPHRKIYEKYLLGFSGPPQRSLGELRARHPR